MTPEQIATLMDGSRARNQVTGVTGVTDTCCVYHEREFMRALDGERSAIVALYDKTKLRSIRVTSMSTHACLLTLVRAHRQPLLRRLGHGLCGG